jgi:hypothetical protein
MNEHELRAPLDDEKASMTIEERSAWIYGIVAVTTTATYFAIVIPRVIDDGAAQASWVTPMLWCLGVSIGATIVLSILGAIGSAIGLAARGVEPEVELSSDQRDLDIKRHADRRAYGALGFGMAGTLVLAMLHVDTFWIGSWILLLGTVGAIIETATKIRAYRRGF